MNKSLRQYLARLAKKGGKARVAALTKAERSALARKAAVARWRGKGAKS